MICPFKSVVGVACNEWEFHIGMGLLKDTSAGWGHGLIGLQCLLISLEEHLSKWHHFLIGMSAVKLFKNFLAVTLLAKVLPLPSRYPFKFSYPSISLSVCLCNHPSVHSSSILSISSLIYLTTDLSIHPLYLINRRYYWVHIYIFMYN